MSKDTNDYLQKGIYGSKKTLVDERHRYLGSIRERIYLTLSDDQLSDEHSLASFKKELKAHPDGKLLLNGRYELSSFEDYLKVAHTKNRPFTMVSNEYAETSPYALIYTASEAVNEPLVDVAKKYPIEENPEKKTSKKKKTSFFKRFFS